jgi:hypothetical protein
MKVALAPSGAVSISTRTTRASMASVTSSLMGATRARASAGGTTREGTFTSNPAVDAKFTALTPRPQMRELLWTNPLPSNNAGQDFVSRGENAAAATPIAVKQPRTARS